MKMSPLSPINSQVVKVVFDVELLCYEKHRFVVQ